MLRSGVSPLMQAEPHMSFCVRRPRRRSSAATLLAVGGMPLGAAGGRRQPLQRLPAALRLRLRLPVHARGLQLSLQLCYCAAHRPTYDHDLPCQSPACILRQHTIKWCAHGVKCVGRMHQALKSRVHPHSVMLTCACASMCSNLTTPPTSLGRHCAFGTTTSCRNRACRKQSWWVCTVIKVMS